MVAAADGSLTGQTPQGDTLRVREVWQDNLEAEMKVGAGGCCGCGYTSVVFEVFGRQMSRVAWDPVPCGMPAMPAVDVQPVATRIGQD